MVKVCFEFDKETYKRLVDIAIDIEPEEYLYKSLMKNLYGTETHSETKVTIVKRNKNISLLKVDDEFIKMKKDFKKYGITQIIAAEYLGTTQASLSYMLQYKNKKSKLYELLFLKSSKNEVLYDIYIYKYEKLFNEYFNLDEHMFLEQWIVNHFKSEKSYFKLLIAIAVEIKINNKYFAFDIFVSKISNIKNGLKKIDLECLKNKDIEYISTKIKDISSFY